jgi:hypothetical protein
LQSSYAAAADLGPWDRDSLEVWEGALRAVSASWPEEWGTLRVSFRSSAESISAPIRITIAESQIHVMNPITAPSEPYVSL